MRLILAQANPYILVSFFEKTDGLIVINQNGEAVDVYYNGVDLEHLTRIMRFAEEGYVATLDCNHGDKQRK